VGNREPRISPTRDDRHPEHIETQHSNLRRILAEISRLIADAQELIEKSRPTRH
jgi:hypothetical protein